MFDAWDYTIPASTSEANRIRVSCPISLGLLVELDVDFPSGCFGLARCRVFLGEKPVFPRSSSSHIKGDNNTVRSEYIAERVKGNLPRLTWEVWNLDVTYSHMLTLKAHWITEEELETQISLLNGMLARLDLIARALYR